MKINGIQEINMEKMSVKVHMYLRVSWTDDQLIFPENKNGSDSGESISLHTDILDHIWNPDHFFRFVYSVREFTLLQKFMGVKLFKTKTIFTSSMHEIEFGCPMNFRNYPFDTQQCLVYMGSYFYNVNEVNFKWHKLGLSIDDAVSKQLADYDFRLTRSNETRCPCIGCFPTTTPCIQLQLTLRRHYLIHLLGYFIPSSLFIMVAWTSFFWPADVIPGRTVLVITSLLTVSSLYATSRVDSPKTSYVKALDAWMFFAIIAGVLTLFQYAVVLQWMRKKKQVSSSKVRPVGNRLDEMELEIHKYELYQERTEWIGRLGLPLMFFIFNIGYWPFFI